MEEENESLYLLKCRTNIECNVDGSSIITDEVYILKELKSFKIIIEFSEICGKLMNPYGSFANTLDPDFLKKIKDIEWGKYICTCCGKQIPDVYEIPQSSETYGIFNYEKNKNHFCMVILCSECLKNIEFAYDSKKYYGPQSQCGGSQGHIENPKYMGFQGKTGKVTMVRIPEEE